MVTGGFNHAGTLRKDFSQKRLLEHESPEPIFGIRPTRHDNAVCVNLGDGKSVRQLGFDLEYIPIEPFQIEGGKNHRGRFARSETKGVC